LKTSGKKHSKANLIEKHLEKTLNIIDNLTVEKAVKENEVTDLKQKF